MHMNSRVCGLLLAISLLSSPCWADEAQPSPAGNEANQSNPGQKNAESPQNLCMKECTRSSARCSAEVRHARSECSRSAALEGESPMGGSRDVEMFCGYFRSATACNSKNADKHCIDRFRARYNMCVAAVRPNVMSSRYDCFQEERQAEGMCRSELNECKAACYQ
jgi:hypothetical protein